MGPWKAETCSDHVKCLERREGYRQREGRKEDVQREGGSVCMCTEALLVIDPI